jgi:serine/threonine protein kinase, bacterial
VTKEFHGDLRSWFDSEGRCRYDGPISSLLAEAGKVFKEFDLQDSGCISYGIETNGGTRLFLKASREDAALPSLRNAIEFYTKVKSPHIVGYRGVIETFDGPVLVFDWFPGEVLYSPEFPGKEGRKDPASPHFRFMQLPFVNRLEVANAIFETHRDIEETGYVAVDFYDGCIIYDFAAKDVRLCDFDNYNLGPFILDRDRNYGSSRFMAPEEFVRGNTIDARTNVYTMGRTASVILADACPETVEWRGPGELLDVVDKATQVAPEDRYQTVGEFCTTWISACDAAGLGR